MAKGAYIGVQKLPSNYIELTHIESSGTQYINTGFNPNQDTRVVMEAQFLENPTSNTICYFGARADTVRYELHKAGGDLSLFFLYNTKLSLFFPNFDFTVRRTVEINKNTAIVDGVTESYDSETFQVSQPIFLGANNNNGTPVSMAAMRIYSCQIYDNDTLVRNYVPCKDPSNVVGLYDAVNGQFYGDANGGVFSAGTSTYTSSVARKIKKGYVGVDNVARKIKKAYVGVGGVARPFWSGGELAYYGTAESLSVERYRLGATTVGDYALFAGGVGYLATIDVYDDNLTRSTATDLSVGRYAMGATTVGDYALFGGGRSSSYPSTTVDVYDDNLTRSTATDLSVGRHTMGVTTVGDYALFAGGTKSSGVSDVVDGYNSNLSCIAVEDLSILRQNLAATTVGNYALFGGGYKSAQYFATVDVYDINLTRSTATDLSVGREHLAATTVGNYALFGSGYTGSNNHIATVDVYDINLTRSTATDLSVGRLQIGVTTVGDYALFAGGSVSSGSTVTYYSTVDVYDDNLTRSTATDLSVGRHTMGVTTVGDYALFAGGYNSSIGGSTATVDVYTAI